MRNRKKLIDSLISRKPCSTKESIAFLVRGFRKYYENTEPLLKKIHKRIEARKQQNSNKL